MSYAEQIRHPSGALESPASNAKEESWWERHPEATLLFYIAIVVLFIYGMWRSNTIHKAAAALGVAVENPFGWV